MRGILAIMALVTFGGLLYAQEGTITDEEAKTLLEQYNETGKLKADEAEALIKYYEAKISEKKSEIDKIKPEVEKLRAEVDKLTALVDSLQKVIAELEAAKKGAEEVAKEEKAEVKPGEYKYYVVKKGDWLSKLAEYPEVYGHGYYMLWPEIYKANKDIIKDPNLIYPGQKLKIPVLTPEQKEALKKKYLKK